MNRERLDNFLLWVVIPVLINLWMGKMLDDLLAEIPHKTQEAFSTSVFIALFVVVVFIAPVIEELAFRKLLWWGMSFLTRNQWVIGVIVALCFTMAHDGALARLGLLPFCFYLSFIRIREGGRLWPLVLAHMSFNTVGMLSS